MCLLRFSPRSPAWPLPRVLLVRPIRCTPRNSTAVGGVLGVGLPRLRRLPTGLLGTILPRLTTCVAVPSLGALHLAANSAKPPGRCCRCHLRTNPGDEPPIARVVMSQSADQSCQLIHTQSLVTGTMQEPLVPSTCTLLAFCAPPRRKCRSAQVAKPQYNKGSKTACAGSPKAASDHTAKGL